MHKILLIMALCSFSGCQSNTTHSHQSEQPINDTSEKISYTALKEKIQQEKEMIKKTKPTSSKIADKYIVPNLLQLFPYWMGTEWNFYGTTETPKQGTIACGYFVTTLLRDAGLTIPRVKLAQQASSQIIAAVCDKQDIHSFSLTQTNNASFFDYIRKQGKALYIIGLDFHTGFIYYDGDAIRFIQAKYYGERCVVDEDATQSAVILQSKFKQIGKISGSEKAGKLFLL